MVDGETRRGVVAPPPLFFRVGKVHLVGMERVIDLIDLNDVTRGRSRDGDDEWGVFGLVWMGDDRFRGFRG